VGVYVAGLHERDVWAAIEREATDLDICLTLHATEAAQIVNDLVTAAVALGFEGVYPPHVQMLIEHMWRVSKARNRNFTIEDYREAGGVQGIIRNYLSRQLDYARDVEGELKSVLISLVRSYGVKAQKVLCEVQADTGFDAEACERALEKID
jgi:hypothetical protein